MIRNAFASALLLTMLAGCGAAPALSTVDTATNLSAASTGTLPVREVLTDKVVAEATADVQKALDRFIPDAYTGVGALSFEPTAAVNVLSFTGIETHSGLAFQYESQVSGIVNLNTGKVTVTHDEKVPAAK